jgi:hypothetical protein
MLSSFLERHTLQPEDFEIVKTKLKEGSFKKIVNILECADKLRRKSDHLNDFENQ